MTRPSDRSEELRRIIEEIDRRDKEKRPDFFEFIKRRLPVYRKKLKFFRSGEYGKLSHIALTERDVDVLDILLCLVSWNRDKIGFEMAILIYNNILQNPYAAPWTKEIARKHLMK